MAVHPINGIAQGALSWFCVAYMSSQQLYKRSVYHRLKPVILVLGLVIFLLLALSYLLRTSTYLKLRVEPKLAALGSNLRGTFQFEQIHAIGVTGILLENVSFTANNTGNPLLRVEHLVIYPALLGMFVGDFDASQLELRGVEVDLKLNPSPQDHRQWLLGFGKDLHTAQTQDGPRGKLTNAETALPKLRIVDAQFQVSLDALRNIQVISPMLEMDFAGALEMVEFSEQESSLCYQEGESSKCTAFMLKAFIPHKRAVTGLWLQQIPWANIVAKDLFVEKLSYMETPQGKALIASKLDFVLGTTQEGMLKAQLTDLPISLYDVQTLWDEKNERLGYGISLRDDKGQLMIFGAYALREKDFSISLLGSHYDLAALFNQALANGSVELHKLPIDGRIDLRFFNQNQELDFDIDVRTEHASALFSWLSSQVLDEISASIKAKGFVQLNDQVLELRGARLSLGAFPVDLDFSLRRAQNDTYALSLRATTQADTALFLPSLPQGLAPALQGYALSGEARASVLWQWDSGDLDSMVFEPQIDLSSVKTLAFNPQSDFNLLKTSAFKMRVKAATRPKYIGPREEAWVRYRDMPKELLQVFISSEDGKFFQHSGFDVRGIRAGIIANLKANDLVRGGSTISQQVVKNLFLNHEKSFGRKFQEAFLTWQMEKHLPKQRILELYINLAHWGPDIYGIKEAARFYFNKSPKNMTLREALLLAAILPNPIIFGKQYVDSKLSDSRVLKMSNNLTALKQLGVVDSTQYELELSAIRAGQISEAPKPQWPK